MQISSFKVMYLCVICCSFILIAFFVFSYYIGSFVCLLRETFSCNKLFTYDHDFIMYSADNIILTHHLQDNFCKLLSLFVLSNKQLCHQVWLFCFQVKLHLVLFFTSSLRSPYLVVPTVSLLLAPRQMRSSCSTGLCWLVLVAAGRCCEWPRPLRVLLVERSARLSFSAYLQVNGSLITRTGTRGVAPALNQPVETS